MYVCLCISRQHPGAVRSVLFSPSGYRLYTSYSAGTLAMFDSEQQSCPLLRLLGNAVVRGEEFGPQALAISEDGQRLAYVGPLQCTVTVLDALSLNEARLFFHIQTFSASSLACHMRHNICFFSSDNLTRRFCDWTSLRWPLPLAPPTL